MKIAYVNASLKVGQDGVTRCVYRMIDAAMARGHEVIGLTSSPPDEPGAFPICTIPSVAIPMHKTYRLALPGVHAVKERLDEFRPDIIHLNSPCTLGYTAMKYGKHRGIPVVATYHTHFPTYPKYYGLGAFEQLTWNITRFFYNHVDRTFVPTQPILEELAAHRMKRLQYMPNGVDTDTFNPRHRSEEWRRQFGDDGKPIVLFVSRLVWEKNLDVLSDAWKLLVPRRGDMHMVVVGEGHSREEFEQHMEGAHFLGYRKGKELSEAFASSDMFVFPSTTETFGLVTLEAMASGLAPVAAKAGGAMGLFEDGVSGLFAEPLSAPDLADKLERLLDDPALRSTIAKNAFEHAGTFRWDLVLARMFDAYADVIAEKQRAPRRRHELNVPAVPKHKCHIALRLSRSAG